MDKEKDKKDQSKEASECKGCDRVKSVLNEKIPELKLDYNRLLESYELPKVVDGKIILNPNNPKHRQWMEDEDDE